MNLQNRIRTIALVNDMFYRTDNLASINLAEYLERIAIHLFNVYRAAVQKISLKTELEPILASINLAIPLGLIVNELISNSLRHAFNENQRRQILITLKRLEDEVYQLKIADDGSGWPEEISWENPTTLGLEIVRLLSQQINADFVKTPKPGTVFVITFSKSLS